MRGVAGGTSTGCGLRLPSGSGVVVARLSGAVFVETAVLGVGDGDGDSRGDTSGGSAAVDFADHGPSPGEAARLDEEAAAVDFVGEADVDFVGEADFAEDGRGEAVEDAGLGLFIVSLPKVMRLARKAAALLQEKVVLLL